MALVIRNIIYYYDYLFNQSCDPRTENLPLVASPWPIAGVIALYLCFVNKWGPKMMAHRKAFDLQNTMIVFNLVQILGNLYIMVFVRQLFPQCPPRPPHYKRSLLSLCRDFSTRTHGKTSPSRANR